MTSLEEEDNLCWGVPWVWILFPLARWGSTVLASYVQAGPGEGRGLVGIGNQIPRKATRRLQNAKLPRPVRVVPQLVAAPGWLLYRNHKPCLPAVLSPSATRDKSTLHEDEWDEFTLDEKETTAPEVVSANGIAMDFQTSGSAAASVDARLLRPVAAPGWLLYRNHKPCLSATSRHVEPVVPISWAPLDKSKLHVDHGMKSEADGANGIFWNCQTSEVDSSETRATSPGTVSVDSEDEDDDARIQDRGDGIRCCPWPHRRLSDGKQHGDKGSVDRRSKQTSLSEHSTSRPFGQPVCTFKTPDGPRQVRGRCAIPSEPLSEARYKGFVKSF